jgi:hypothetical protein
MFPVHMSTARIEGNIVRIVSRARHTFCFEGSGLRKVGAGSLVLIDVGEEQYAGELVAISPTRVIVHVVAPLETVVAR